MSDDTPLALVAAVRRGGVAVRTEAVASFVEALAHLDLDRPASLYWAGRLTLVDDRDDLAAYDAAFLRFVAGADTPDPDDDGDEDEQDAGATALAETVGAVTGAPEAAEPDDDRDGSGDEGSDLVLRTVAGVAERLAGRDFAACTPAELVELARAVDRIRATPAVRRSRACG